MREETRYRQELVHFGKLLHDYGYVAATNGNLSVRLDSRSILITPTSICKGMMRPRDLIVVDKDGHTVRGRGRVSSEIAMHLLIYSVRPDINAVVHAHPPLATGYASAGIPLNPALVSEAVLGVGGVPLAPYAPPGTVELADALRPLIAEHQAILMANHGVVTAWHRPVASVPEDGVGGTLRNDFARDETPRTRAPTKRKGSRTPERTAAHI